MRINEEINKKKPILIDLILSTIAIGLPIAIMQLFIYPKMAKNMSADAYGLMQTIYSGWFVISSPFAGCVSSIKLLYNNEYRSKNIEGDFPIIIKRWSILVFILTSILTFYYYKQFDVFHILLSAIVATLYFFATYYETEFRININYKKIVINKIILSIGYILGLLLFILTEIWEFVYILGYGSSLVYSLTNSSLLKEKVEKTPLYDSTLKDCRTLLLSNFAGSLSSYGDKLILYPLMGGTAVSIYYTSTLIGKAISLFASSLRDVMLSYVAKLKNNNNAYFIFVIIFGLCISVIGYICALFISEFIISKLFSQWFVEVEKYLPITTATYMLDIVISLIFPFTIKFCDVKWQNLINIVSLVVYILLAVLLWSLYGLTGFCFGAMAGYLCKIILMVYVYFKKGNK